MVRESQSHPTFLQRRGSRVHIRPPRHTDLDAYARAVKISAQRIGEWNPVNPHDLTHHIEAQSDRHRTFLIFDNDIVPADDALAETQRGNPPQHIVGCVNVTNVIEGRFRSASMGYNAFDPFVGTGLFAEGLRLVVETALTPAPSGMGLHRVEANVRPGNSASAGLLRSLGFRRERTIRRMLWLANGLDGPSEWRDHDSYAVTREEWPPPRYAANDQPRGVLVASDVDVPTACAVARELGGVTLFGLPYESALAVAQASAAPVIWIAGSDRDKAVDELTTSKIPTANADEVLRAAEQKQPLTQRLDVGTQAGDITASRAQASPAEVVRAALALRIHLS